MKHQAKAWWDDPDVKFVRTKSQFNSVIQDAFNRWGDDARAIVRVKWMKKYGGEGHFFTARRINGKIIYTDPQINQYHDIADTLKKCATSQYALWIMRVDNRELTEAVQDAVKDVK